MTDFTYPETIERRDTFVTVKSRVLEPGRVEAVAAFYLHGRREVLERAIGATRGQAETAVRRQLVDRD